MSGTVASRGTAYDLQGDGAINCETGAGVLGLKVHGRSDPTRTSTLGGVELFRPGSMGEAASLGIEYAF